MQTSISNPSVVTRRQLMKVSSAGIAASLLTKDNQVQGAVQRSDSIDAHVHVWTPDTKRYPLAAGFSKDQMQPPSFTPEQLMAHAGPVGVSKVVLIQMSFYGFDNSYMLDVMNNHKGVYSGVAVIDETQRPDAVMKSLAKKGVRGFRIRPHGRQPEDWLGTDGMKTMWKCGADEGLSMCHLIDPEYLPSVEKMCLKNPRTPVVIDHFARIGVNGKIKNDDVVALCRLSKFKTVSVKVSAFYALGKKTAPYKDLIPLLRRVLDAYGPERLMWASDCPFQVQQKHTYRASIDLIQNEVDFLSGSDRQWLLRKTAAKVFFA